ncbi:MAG TPA: Rpn family recombination-promoting nuclease/putative transposase [Gemmataceae bacterium]|jgi:predicted transposase/invertase (TIGR01784 family)|nr:Rpn family recombination-promoting nuclease/putative transposase [Gemmataceae bacterium]
MILGIDPKVDYAFKLLLGRDETQALLIEVLNGVLERPEGERVESVQILNPFNPKAAWNDKLSIVDVRARDQSDRWFNVEMQILSRPSFASRIVYYAAKTFQQQLHEGDGYEKLRPTISICFLNHVLFPAVPDYHLCFRLLERTLRFPLTDDLEFHFFELPKFQKSAEQLGAGIEAWLYFLRHAEKMDTEAVPAALQTPSILRALRELEMVTQDEIQRIRYEERVESQRAYNYDLRMSKQEGLQEGRQKGRQEEKVGSIRRLERMLGRPESPTERFGGLSLEELDRMAEDLERQFHDKG